MEQMEKAAEIILAPPDVVSPLQRQEAEQLFLQFRQTKNPFSTCRDILENGRAQYLLFEAASLLRMGVIREWKELSVDDRIQLRQYVMQYLVSRADHQPFVRETLVQVVAIMLKRGFTDGDADERDAFLGEVEQLVRSQSNELRMIGCSIFSAILQEYAVTVKSSDVGITWEAHFKAKKLFETNQLKRIFVFVVSLLKEAVDALKGVSGDNSSPPALPDGSEKELLRRLLLLAEMTLTWSFITIMLSKRLMSVLEQDQNPSLRPGQAWIEIFQDASFLPLFFKLYWNVRGDWDLGHHALNCLVQLSSLNGVVLVNKHTRLAYLTNYLNCFFSLLSSTEVQECEALGISQIFRKLLQFFPPSILVALPPELLAGLVDHLTKLCCQFAQHAAMEEHTDIEDQLYMEAFDQILHSWCCIIQESSCVPTGSYTFMSAGRDLSSPPSSPNNNTSIFSSLKDKIKEGSTLIFDTYLKYHLSPPEGSRQQLGNVEITESNVPDRILFQDQLVLIGACARQNLPHCVPVLCELLEQRVTQLRTFLCQAHANNRQSSEVTDNLYEDLHWLLLITGNVLMMDSEGESSSISRDITQYSVSLAPRTDVQATLALLAAPQSMPAELGVPSAMQVNNIDPVIRTIAAVFKLAHIEGEALAAANLIDSLSPELSCSLIWFLRRFILSYLLPRESSDFEISVAINSAFGRDSEGAVWTVNFLLNIIERTLRLRAAEPELINETVKLFLRLVDNKERGQLVMKAEKLLDVVRLQHCGQLAVLSSSASRGLMNGLVLMIGSAGVDAGTKEEVWQHVLDPNIRAFHNLLDRHDFTKNCHKEEYRKEVMHHLDNLCGAIKGSHVNSAAILFNRIGASLQAIVKLLDLYHNYSDMVENLLEVYVECGRRLLCYLTPAASKQLYECAVEMIKVYAKHNIGRRTVGSEDQQDQYRDLQLLMELLTSLLSKDFIDLAPTSVDDEEHTIAAADVCLYGLNIIMPLMSHELLKIPSLCTHYYKLIAFIAEIYPSKIPELPSDLLKNLLASVELGLTAFSMEVSANCFDFLVVLSTYVFKNCSPDSAIKHSLRPFLKTILDLIVSQQLNSDVMQAASGGLYILICCFQEDYRELVGQLIAAQPDPVTGQRLADAFTKLTENVELTGVKAHRFKFRGNFETFLANIRGFLLIK